MKIAIESDYLTILYRFLWAEFMQMLVLEECAFGLCWFFKRKCGVDLDVYTQVRLKVRFLELHVQFSNTLLLFTVGLESLFNFMPRFLHLYELSLESLVFRIQTLVTIHIACHFNIFFGDLSSVGCSLSVLV